MTEPVRLSVITPVLNNARFIRGCIAAVVGQGCPAAEHIIVDGGSTDGTVEAIREEAKRHPHIRWICEKDEGQSDALNKGISMARGEILSILNVDDFFEPGVLNRVVDAFGELSVPSLLVGNCNVWDDAGELLYVNRPRKLHLEDLLLGFSVNPYPVNPSAYYYHRVLHEIVGPYDVADHYAMDVDFLFRAVQVAELHYVDEALGNFRLIEGTKTRASLEGRVPGPPPVERLFRIYERQLPLPNRLRVSATRRVRRLLSRVRRSLGSVARRLRQERT